MTIVAFQRSYTRLDSKSGDNRHNNDWYDGVDSTFVLLFIDGGWGIRKNSCRSAFCSGLARCIYVEADHIVFV